MKQKGVKSGYRSIQRSYLLPHDTRCRFCTGIYFHAVHNRTSQHRNSFGIHTENDESEIFYRFINQFWARCSLSLQYSIIFFNKVVYSAKSHIVLYTIIPQELVRHQCCTISHIFSTVRYHSAAAHSGGAGEGAVAPFGGQGGLNLPSCDKKI